MTSLLTTAAVLLVASQLANRIPSPAAPPAPQAAASVQIAPDDGGAKAVEAARMPPPLDRIGVDFAEPMEIADPAKQELDAALSPTVEADETLPGGYRRSHYTQRVALSPALLQELRESGKSFRLDPETNELLLETFRDHLPANWRMHAAAGELVDSYGNPIVNQTPGLPDWAQRDVTALRSAIVQWRDERARQASDGQDTAESSAILGNFIGQAIVRGIEISDVVNLNDPGVVDASVAASIIGHLHFYENLKFVHAEVGQYEYVPSSYPAEIADFVAAHGASLAEVLAIEPPDTMTMRGGAPSGCYARTAFTRGMSLLSGQTDIWVANGFDDASADIPTGFPLFFFYDCQDSDNNDTVRVSTNGYVSFFQQGGGALVGTSFGNDPIPLAQDPDGFVAPWWDDLIVATNQGNTDRVSYKTEGSIDSRVFTVEYFSISRLGGDTNEFHFFQAKLFETTDVVELHISTDWQTDSADSATTGIENYDGAGGDCGPNCLETNNPPPPNNYRFTPSPRPDNDSCGNAIEVINGASVVGNLHRATPDGDASCGSSSNNRDVWYTFVARCNGTLHVDTCGSRDFNGAATGIDTVLSVHSACPGTAANQLACNDDAGAAGCSGNDSAVSVAMTSGQRVFIRVTHFGDLAFRFASGAFRMNVNFISTSAPANNACAAATPILNGNTLVGNLLCASNDGSADCGSSATNPDIWYQFTAPPTTPGTLALSLCGSRNNSGADTGPDTVLSVHSGCPGTPGNELACNDDGFIPGCNSLDSRLFVALAPGENVKIRVSHFGDNAFRVGNGVTVLHADFGCNPPCPGDLNQDGQIGIQDLSILLAHFGSCHPSTLYEPAADLDCDGCVRLQDLAELLGVFGSSCP
ncbi:MAG: hypothetical protein IT450_12325 [Phycisphaerales bacterium]|nr:hypothetical protein [Phycisphaerales bacterium]